MVLSFQALSAIVINRACSYSHDNIDHVRAYAALLVLAERPWLETAKQEVLLRAGLTYFLDSGEPRDIEAEKFSPVACELSVRSLHDLPLVSNRPAAFAGFNPETGTGYLCPAVPDFGMGEEYLTRMFSLLDETEKILHDDLLTDIAVTANALYSRT